MGFIFLYLVFIYKSIMGFIFLYLVFIYKSIQAFIFLAKCLSLAKRCKNSINRGNILKYFQWNLYIILSAKALTTSQKTVF